MISINSLSSVLTVVFIVLKLIGTITWSWLWVLAPTWISIVLSLIAFIIMIYFYTDHS